MNIGSVRMTPRRIEVNEAAMVIEKRREWFRSLLAVGLTVVIAVAAVSQQMLKKPPDAIPTGNSMEKAPMDQATSDRMALLSKVWAAAYFFCANLDDKVVDWDGTLSTCLTKCSGGMDDDEFVNLLRRMLAEIKDGHTEFVDLRPRTRLRASPDLLLDSIEDRTVLKWVGPGIRATHQGLLPGLIVETIDGVPVDKAFAEEAAVTSASTPEQLKVKVYRALLSGPPDRTISLGLLMDDGSRQVVELSRDTPPEGIAARIGDAERLPIGEEYCIGYIPIASFRDESSVLQFRAMLKRLADCNGLVLDVRGNGGGNDQYAFQMAAHLTDRPLVGHRERHRRHERNSINQWLTLDPVTVQPDPELRYLGPMALLVDEATQSAAEDFVLLLQQSGRAKIVGRKTSGSTGQPLFLQVGDYGIATICTAQCLRADLSPFQTTPDLEVPLSLQALRSDTDEILDAAIRLLRESM